MDKNKYRAAIYVDIHDVDIQSASKKLSEYLDTIPNSFTDGISKLPQVETEPTGS